MHPKLSFVLTHPDTGEELARYNTDTISHDWSNYPKSWQETAEWQLVGMNFTVPEGYFDTLAERVMERIPENEVRMMPETVRKPLAAKRWRTVAAAAVVLAAVFGAGLYVHQDLNDAEVEAMATQRASYSNAEGSLDAVADYIMCDDEDLYAYLSDE